MERGDERENCGGGWVRLWGVFALIGVAVTALLCAAFALCWAMGAGGG